VLVGLIKLAPEDIGSDLQWCDTLDFMCPKPQRAADGPIEGMCYGAVFKCIVCGHWFVIRGFDRLECPKKACPRAPLESPMPPLLRQFDEVTGELVPDTIAPQAEFVRQVIQARDAYLAADRGSKDAPDMFWCFKCEAIHPPVPDDCVLLTGTIGRPTTAPTDRADGTILGKDASPEKVAAANEYMKACHCPPQRRIKSTSGHCRYCGRPIL
jgi:hypothetical protein